jgi:hypothetical protein
MSILDNLKTVDEILLEMEQTGYREFLVDGLISSSVTTIIGDPYIGKTCLAIDAARSLTTGEAFLGRSVVRTVDRIAFLCTDPNGRRDVAERVRNAELDKRRVLAQQFYTPASFDEWKLAVNDLRRERVGAIVVDNTTDLALDANNPADVKTVIDGLRLWSDDGATILNLHHRNKSAARGYFGSVLWQKWTRLELELTGSPRSTVRRIQSKINNGAPVDLALSFDPAHSPAFTVTKSRPVQDRNPETLNRNAQIAAWDRLHPGLSRRDAAPRATADLGFKVSESRIQRVRDMHIG